ncbi:MAG: hypothetical protein ACYC7E_00705 [Armatimonadota bacterium]
MQQISIWSIAALVLPFVGPLLGIVASLVYAGIGSADDRAKIRQIIAFTVLGLLIDAALVISFFPDALSLIR